MSCRRPTTGSRRIECCTSANTHYDRDFDTIARFTEQPARWIVPPGTA
jgi:hypothetical protein